MKTKKLNLGELKVKSFVTGLEGKKGNTVKGGNDPEYDTIRSVCGGSCLRGLC